MGFDEAQAQIQTGLQKNPNHLVLLIIANDVYRSSGNHEGFEYAEQLITHHPDNWNGYVRSAEALNLTDRFNKIPAQNAILAGLNILPKNFWLLITASEIYRASGDYDKSLRYSELLITTIQIMEWILTCSRRSSCFEAAREHKKKSRLIEKTQKIGTLATAHKVYHLLEILISLYNVQSLLLHFIQMNALIPTPGKTFHIHSRSFKSKINRQIWTLKIKQ